jgi:ubiquinone/menaquinone biosynthesis C-methylase UbiE
MEPPRYSFLQSVTDERKEKTMSQQVYGETFSGTAAENYERYFVPTIGAPLARDLIRAAGLQPGERVLDVASGTGVVTRLAAEALGAGSKVAGLDVNPEMLEVARSVAPTGFELEWYETSAEATPLPDDAFDVILCQMGLQFMPDKIAALREMRRILAPGGRLVLNVPGPTPRLFTIMAQGLGRNIHPDCAAFPDMVFSLYDADELRALIGRAGFESIDIRREVKVLPLPEPKQFLWQYVYCTPLANPVSAATDEQRAAAEREIGEAWQDLIVDGTLNVEVGMTTACAR